MSRMGPLTVLFSGIALAVLAIASETEQSSSTLNADILSSAQLAAASTNMGFYSVFFFDYNFNQPKYSSYMNQDGITFPQDVQSYFQHLQKLSSTADLTQDVALNFPFTQFQTFITALPWYGALLSEASMSTLYLPQFFISEANATAQTGASPSQPKVTAHTDPTDSTRTSLVSSMTYSSSSSNTISSATDASSNKAATCHFTFAVFLLAALSFIL